MLGEGDEDDHDQRFFPHGQQHSTDDRHRGEDLEANLSVSKTCRGFTEHLCSTDDHREDGESTKENFRRMKHLHEDHDGKEGEGKGSAHQTALVRAKPVRIGQPEAGGRSKQIGQRRVPVGLQAFRRVRKQLEEHAVVPGDLGVQHAWLLPEQTVQTCHRHPPLGRQRGRRHALQLLVRYVWSMPEGPENTGRFRNGSHGQVNLYTNFSGGGRNLWGPDLIQVFQSASGFGCTIWAIHAQQRPSDLVLPCCLCDDFGLEHRRTCINLDRGRCRLNGRLWCRCCGDGRGLYGTIDDVDKHLIFIHHAPRWCPIHINAPTIGLSGRVPARTPKEEASPLAHMAWLPEGWTPSLVAVDIDGTLTDANKLLHVGAVEALRALEAAGIPVIICTGNTRPIAYGLWRFIGLSGPLVCENGGVLWYPDGEVVLRAEGREAEEACRWVAEHIPGIDADGIATNRWRESEWCLKTDEDMEAIQAALADSRWSHLTVLRTGFAIHVMDPCLSKGQGLSAVLERLGVAAEDVLAVGDAPNDLSMFELVGWSVAVGGAFPELQAVASVCSAEPHGATFPPLVDAILAQKSIEG